MKVFFILLLFIGIIRNVFCINCYATSASCGGPPAEMHKCLEKNYVKGYCPPDADMCIKVTKEIDGYVLNERTCAGSAYKNTRQCVDASKGSGESGCHVCSSDYCNGAMSTKNNVIPCIILLCILSGLSLFL